MNSTIALTFRYCPDDVAKAMRLHFLTHMHVKTDLALALLLGAAGIYLLYSPTWRAFGIAAVVLAVLLLAIITLAFVVIPILRFRSDPRYKDEYALTFSPEGIHFRTVHVDSKLQWNFYSKAVVDHNSYLLYHGKRMFSTIPRRIFESDEQCQAFERLIVDHIPNVKRRDALI